VITRPFIVRCFETEPAETLEVIVRFGARRLLNDEGMQLLQRLMRHLVSVGSNGGLSGSEIRPNDSTLFLASERISADICTWRLENVRIASSARLVFENIVHFVHLNVAPVSQLDLRFQPGGGMMKIPDTPLGRFVPPFRCVIEPVAAEVVIDLEFDDALDDKNVSDQFINFWDSWLYVAAAGGFETSDFSSRIMTIFPVDEPDTGTNEISFFMDDVSVGDSAFDVLVNGFHRLHSTLASISSLHIY
jgi:hypothetical protein